MARIASRWPLPGDGPLTRARKVANAYRAALHAANPQACAELDNRMRCWGQHWAIPRIVRFELDDWVGVADAADLASVDSATLRQWRRRGRISGRQTEEGRWEYRAGDILNMAASVRRRAPREAS